MNHRLLTLLLVIGSWSLHACPSIDNLTIEEMVGQLLMVHFHGESANADAKKLIEEAYIGNFIYFGWANGLHSPQQVLRLGNGLQQLAAQAPNPIPLLIAIDQEGGVVSRLRHGFTIFPSSGAIGKTEQPEISRACAHAVAEELAAVGINMILGPVVDIATNPYNPIIGIRAFGNTPQTVIAHGSAAIAGYHDHGTLTVLKHFPGHGDVTLDSHIGLPILSKPLELLQREEFLPFAALCHQADAIMTAHLLVPAIDPLRCITLSPIALETILRQEMGFNGVIMSDSLAMQGFLANGAQIEEAAIRAIEGGCDMLILGGKQLFKQSGFELDIDTTLSIYIAIVNAVKSGRISQERLDRSVNRILTMKHNNGLCSKVSPYSDNLDNALNSSAHRELAQTVARNALEANSNRVNATIDFSASRVAVFAPSIIRDAVDKTSLLKIGKETKGFFFKELDPSVEELQEALQLLSWASTCVVCSYNAWNYAQQQDFIELLLNSNKPVAILILCDPLDSDLIPSADIVISTLSPDAFSIQSAIDLLLSSE